MTTSTPALVSIVTPVYNSVEYLEVLLRSVEEQVYPRIEHIVIDDGSTDLGATKALLATHPKVRWWARGNIGQYATLNEGFRAATGDYITTISADDYYVDSSAVGALVGYLDKHDKCDVVHGATVHVDSSGMPLLVQPYQNHPYWMLQYNLGFIFHCSVLVRRRRLLADGLLFNEALRFTGDGDWMARLYRAGYRFHRLDRPVAAYRHHALQVSATTTSDAVAAAERRREHAAVAERYARSRVAASISRASVTFHRRRVKAQAAWQTNGIVGVWSEYCKWRKEKTRSQVANGTPRK